MEFSEVLVAYSEIALKSEPVRRRLEDMLMKNIAYMLARSGISRFSINKEYGRIFVRTEEAKRASEAISKVFGVAYSMPSIKTASSLSDIIEGCKKLAEDIIRPGEKFAIKARRAGNHPFTSKEIEERAGAEVLKKLSERGVKVDLKNPDKIIYVEAREEYSYISDEIKKGVGGLPLGSQGKVIALFSGEINSAISAWMMMKRGAFPILVYLDMNPYWEEIQISHAISVARYIREFVTMPDFRFIIIPTGFIIHEIIEKCPRELTCILCKRIMYRIACKIAEEKGALAIVTGEGLGQMAFQIISNLSVLDEATKLPIFRPLIGMNEDEVEEIGRKLGLSQYKESIPRCTAASPKPLIGIDLQEVKDAESKLDVEGLIERALEKEEVIIL